MSATRQEVEDSLFEDPGFEEKSIRFATDLACPVVYITQERILRVDRISTSSCTEANSKIMPVQDIPLSRIIYRLHLPPTPPHSSSTLSTLALIKSSQILDTSSALGYQLHFVLLSSPTPGLLADDGSSSGDSTAVTTPAAQSTPYGGLHSLVHWGVAPWFESYVNSKQDLLEGTAVNKRSGDSQMGKTACTV